MTLKNNRAPLLCCFNLCASLHSQWWIQTWVTNRKHPIWSKIDAFLAMWPWNLTDELEDLDLWPCPFAWTSCLSMVINFRMIRWQEHCQKGVTDGQTDRQTEISVLRAAWSQLKTQIYVWYIFCEILKHNMIVINNVKYRWIHVPAFHLIKNIS